MPEPLALVVPQDAAPLAVGDLVANFSAIGRVVEVRSAPHNDVVLRAIGKRSRWIADPALCRPVR